MDRLDLLRLERDSWFGALPGERRAALLARLRTRDTDHGTRIYRLGDRPNGLHVVLDGRVQLVSYSADGGEMVGMIVKPGRWFGELSVLDGKPRPHDAIAVGTTRLGHLPIAEIAALAERAPLFWRELALLTCAHQRLSIRDTARTRSQPAIVRLAILLAGNASPADPIVRITQDELARTVGISRQHANRLLAQLGERGLVRRVYGAIEIADPQGLRDFADQAD
ncbi:MAG: Crp/Fnr family transcriptional regulator [Sphingomonadaceae bacterium]|nr:Crp/Fnr family transcriptional regulator [Sphingomonadaceae bacterium]